MADEERPSLEPPKLFGRRRRTTPATTPDPVDAAPSTAPVATPAEPVEPAGPAEPVFEDSGNDPAESRRTTIVEIPQADAVDPLDDPLDDDLLDEPDDDSGDPAPGEPSPTHLTGRPAGALVGLVVGGAMVGLTWLLGQACSLAVSGTSSCGTALGMVGIVVVFAVGVVLGGILLRQFRCPDPGATSFLGAGLTGVIVLLFLVEQLDTWLAVALVPAITAVAYVLSWWVTTTYTDNDTI